LARRGYVLLPAGLGERLLPVTETITERGGTTKITREQVGPATVATHEFKLPFG